MPGAEIYTCPDDTALKFPAGSRLRIDAHYATYEWESDVDIPDDALEIWLWTWREPTPPSYRAVFVPFGTDLIRIPAFEPEVRAGTFQPGSLDGTLIGGAPHMHFLGVRFEASIRSVDGSSHCVFDVDDFDFHTQSLYRFEPPYPVVASDDVVSVSCFCDNSAANQPIVDGEQRAPVDVTYGPSSLDEMCEMNLVYRVPNEAQ